MIAAKISAKFQDEVLRASQIAMSALDVQEVVRYGIECFEEAERAYNQVLLEDGPRDEISQQLSRIVDWFREVAPLASILCQLIRRFQAEGHDVERAEEFFRWTHRIVHDVIDDSDWNGSGLAEQEAEAVKAHENFVGSYTV